MNICRYTVAATSIFVFVFAFDFLIHGVLLMDLYTQTANLWRTDTEYEALMHYMLLSQVAFSLLVVLMYSKFFKNKSLFEGVKFGTFIGLILASIQLSTYSYMPIPLMLTLSWMLASFLRGVGAGLIIGLIVFKLIFKIC